MADAFCIASCCGVNLSHRKALTLFGMVNKVHTLILVEEGFGFLIEIHFGSGGVLLLEDQRLVTRVKQPT